MSPLPDAPTPLTQAEVIAQCDQRAARIAQLAGPALAALLTAPSGSLADDILRDAVHKGGPPYSLKNHQWEAIELASSLAADLADALEYAQGEYAADQLAKLGLL